MFGRLFKFVAGSMILLVALLLPYRMRIAFSDLLGRFINYYYHLYIRLFRWFLSKLQEK